MSNNQISFVMGSIGLLILSISVWIKYSFSDFLAILGLSIVVLTIFKAVAENE